MTTMAFWRKKTPTTPESTSAASNAADKPSTSQSTSDGPTKEEANETETKGGLFAKIRGAFAKTHQWLKTDIRDLWKSEGRLVDEDFLRELFAVLINSDMGN